VYVAIGVLVAVYEAITVAVGVGVALTNHNPCNAIDVAKLLSMTAPYDTFTGVVVGVARLALPLKRAVCTRGIATRGNGVTTISVDDGVARATMGSGARISVIAI